MPLAFVALRSALDIDAHAAWCRERLAHYKLPREFRIVDVGALPRSSTGKIQRHEIERRMSDPPPCPVPAYFCVFANSADCSFTTLSTSSV